MREDSTMLEPAKNSHHIDGEDVPSNGKEEAILPTDVESEESREGSYHKEDSSDEISSDSKTSEEIDPALGARDEVSNSNSKLFERDLKTRESDSNKALSKSIDYVSNLDNLNSNLVISNSTGDLASDGASKDKFTSLHNDFSIKIAISESVRRNSLPEGGKIASNVAVEVESHKDEKLAHSLQSERAKVAPNVHNISDVVRNVHGLFSIVKNAYRPVERNIGEIILATQKNLHSAKSGYLNSRQESKSQEIIDNLNKYPTLQLSNDNQDANNDCKDENHPEHASVQNSNEKTKNCRDSNFKNDSLQNAASECLKNLELVENNRDAVNKCINNVFSIDDAGVTSHARAPGCSEVDRQDSFEVLEATVLEQNVELDALRVSLSQKDALNKSLEAKISNLSKQLEASVMRYAVSERTALGADKALATATTRETRAIQEAALLERRLRAAQAERSRICDMLDQKAHDLNTSQKEIARLKEELQGCEVKLKWTQNKLMSEIESHKEASSLAERLGHQLAQMESSSSEPSQSPQQSSDIDAQMMEKEASAILERHERQRLETLCRQLQGELESMRASMASMIAEARELRSQVGCSAAEAETLRAACTELRAQSARDCERLAAAQARAARADTLAAHLQQEQERGVKLQQELEAEKRARGEALADAELSTRREAELLRQAERLTAAGVRLQAACSEAEAKALALTVDNQSLRAAAALEAERRAGEALRAEREREGRTEDARALAGAAARHQRAAELAQLRLERAEGDHRAATAKHASAVKELKREAQQWKRKCEKLETEGHTLLSGQNQVTQRTGSCSSLSSFEGSSSQPITQTETSDPTGDGQVDRHQTRLQFLEGHTAQLTAELQKKSKLLRALMMATPAGAMSKPSSDRNKVEMGRHGGIMASVYNNEVSDTGLTLELSLEMSARLQALLEDTLLKNITLKENMDTLGDEITRLKEELKRRNKK